MKHGILGTINVRTAVLKNACTNTDCAWHTCHWRGLYENGCYMLKDNSKCISGEKTGYMSVEQYIAQYVPEDLASNLRILAQMHDEIFASDTFSRMQDQLI